MHIIVVAEGYKDDLDEAKRIIEQMYHPAINPVDGKPTYFSPILREVRLYDVVFPKEIKERVLNDLGMNTDVKVGLWHRPPKMVSWLLKIFKPMGWCPVKFTKDKNIPPGRLKRGIDPVKKSEKGYPYLIRAHIIPIAEKEDLHDGAYECV